MTFSKSDDDVPQFHGDPVGGLVGVRQTERKGAKKIVRTPSDALTIEEIGGLSMPKKTENKLVKLLDHWATKFSALNADLDQVLAESRASREQIEKDMRERRAIFESGLNL